MQTLFESTRYLVTANLHQHGPVIVTFPGVRDHPGIERHRSRPWLGTHLEAIGCNWVAVTPEINDWYQHPDIEGVIEAINEALYGEQPVTLGSSMGGLGAWTLSAELNAQGWIVFGANWKMSTDIGWDHRVMAERRRVEASHGWRETKQVSANGHVWYDPRNFIDNQHARQIIRETRGIDCPRDGLGHNLLKAWKEKNILRNMLHLAINRAAHINIPVS